KKWRYQFRKEIDISRFGRRDILVVGPLNQPARIDQLLPSNLKESFTRARYSTIFPFSIRMSSWSTSAILRSLRLLVEVSMTSFAASSQEVGLVPTSSTIL